MKKELLKAIDDKINSLDNTAEVNQWQDFKEFVEEFKVKGSRHTAKALTQDALELILDHNKKHHFLRWIQYRKGLGKTIKVWDTLKRLAQKFNDTDLYIIKQTIDYSIDNQYQGLFWDQFNKKSNDKQTRAEKFKEQHNNLFSREDDIPDTQF